MNSLMQFPAWIKIKSCTQLTTYIQYSSLLPISFSKCVIFVPTASHKALQNISKCQKGTRINEKKNFLNRICENKIKVQFLSSSPTISNSTHEICKWWHQLAVPKQNNVYNFKNFNKYSDY